MAYFPRKLRIRRPRKPFHQMVAMLPVWCPVGKSFWFESRTDRETGETFFNGVLPPKIDLDWVTLGIDTKNVRVDVISPPPLDL